jgi:hypothetical protein
VDPDPDAVVAPHHTHACGAMRQLLVTDRNHALAPAISAITFDSWLPCQAIGECPGLSVTSCAPGIAAA